MSPECMGSPSMAWCTRKPGGTLPIQQFQSLPIERAALREERKTRLGAIDRQNSCCGEILLDRDWPTSGAGI
jgi:hypothetical protein